MTAATTLEPAKPIANQFVVNDWQRGAARHLRSAGRRPLRRFPIRGLSSSASNDEITDAAGNASADKAIDVPLGTTVNGRVDANTYRLPAARI